MKMNKKDCKNYYLFTYNHSTILLEVRLILGIAYTLFQSNSWFKVVLYSLKSSNRVCSLCIVDTLVNKERKVQISSWKHFASFPESWTSLLKSSAKGSHISFSYFLERRHRNLYFIIFLPNLWPKSQNNTNLSSCVS